MNTPLYKRSSNGKIETWQIFVDGDGFYTVAGQLGGKLSTSAKTKCQGKNLGKKNETTAEQQAELEAKAKCDKKLKDGYVVDLSQVDEVTKLVPQLAKVYGDYKDKVKFPVISSEKMDGTRLLASKNGLFTRNGEKYVSIPHIYEALKPVFEQYPDLVLDGEAFNLELKDNFNKIISLVKKKKPTAEELAESKELIKFYIFDMVFAVG
jgi:ATP-dependent DNA ligase